MKYNQRALAEARESLPRATARHSNSRIRPDDLVGKVALTIIKVPSTGRVVATLNEVITPPVANEIARLKTVRSEIVHSMRPNCIFQTSQAHGSGLIDERGKVY